MAAFDPLQTLDRRDIISAMMSGIGLFLVAAAIGAAGPVSKQPTVTACDVSLQAVKELASNDHGKPIVFEVGDPAVSVKAEDLAKGWSTVGSGKTIEVPAPPMELLAEFAVAIRDSVSRCQSVRSYLWSHKIKYGKAAVDAVVARANDDDELPAGIFTVSLPAISRTGQMALIYTSETWGGEAGGGFARMYERNRDGTWHFIAERRLWIS